MLDENHLILFDTPLSLRQGILPSPKRARSSFRPSRSYHFSRSVDG